MRMWRNPVTGKLDLVLRSLSELTVKDHDLLDGLTDNDHTQYVLRNQWLQNGFVDATEVSLSWDDATRTLTIQPSGASFNYFLDGILYNETGSITEQITDTEGLWIFYIDAEDSIASIRNPSTAQIKSIHINECLVAYVYWDATNNDGRLMSELHGYNMNPVTHHWIHDNIGSVYRSGMALSDFVIDDNGDDAEDAQFSVASGSFDDEDIANSLSAVTKTTGLEIWYLSGSDWRWTTNAGYSVLTTGSGRLAFNDSGAQTEVANNSFVLCHVFATNIVSDSGTSPKYIAIQGQAQYATIVAARTGAETEINSLVFGSLPLQEVVPVATVIFQTADGYGNAVKGRTRTTGGGDNYVDWRASSLKATGGSIVDHGALAGLADDDHAQYLLIDGTRAMTGSLLIDGGNIGITADSDLIALAENSFTVNGNISVTGTVDGVDVAGLNTAYLAHVHDGDTLQADGINSNGGAFAFTTTGAVTFNQDILVDGGNIGISADTDLLSLTSGLLTVNGSLLTTNNTTIITTMFDSNCIEINALGSGNRYAYIDFHGDDNFTDYALRILRGNTGQNAQSQIDHRGTGDFIIKTVDVAPLLLQTASNTRLTVAANGNVTLSHDLRVDGQHIGISSDTDLLYLANNTLVINGTSFYLRGPNDNYLAMTWENPTTDATHVRWSWYKHNNNLDYFLQSYDGTDYKVFLRFYDAGDYAKFERGELYLPAGTGINEFSIDGNLSGNSDDAVPTEKAVKTYVDAQAGTYCKIKTGTYTGDGGVSQGITGVGFAPKWVKIWIYSVTDGAYCNQYETTDLIVDDHASGVAHEHQTLGHVSQLNTIISLDADGFTVDDAAGDKDPNKNGVVYYYIALG